MLSTKSEDDARKRFRLCTQAQWNYERAKVSLANGNWRDKIKPLTYRPFDIRTTVYDSHVAVHLRDRVMRHMLEGSNIGLCFNRSVEEQRPFTDAFVFSGLIQHHSLSLKEVNYIAPLYIYPSEQDLDRNRRINFDEKLYSKLKKLTGNAQHGEPAEMAVFDYIYGVLHCPAYRETYADFLKIDFPRIPWPTSPDEFWDVSDKGSQLRKLHLMEPSAIGATPYPLKGEGDSVVDKIRFEDSKVWINATQYFEGAPPVSWGFYIGGYQPAQKWLKDRKGRTLSFDDVKHYQKILKILAETDRVMKTISMGQINDNS